MMHWQCLSGIITGLPVSSLIATTPPPSLQTTEICDNASCNQACVIYFFLDGFLRAGTIAAAFLTGIGVVLVRFLCGGGGASAPRLCCAQPVFAECHRLNPALRRLALAWWWDSGPLCRQCRRSLFITARGALTPPPLRFVPPLIPQYAVVGWTTAGSCFSCVYRRRIRAKYSIPPPAVGDCCYEWLCGVCSLALVQVGGEGEVCVCVWGGGVPPPTSSGGYQRNAA